MRVEQKVRIYLGASILEVNADHELISLEIVDEQTKKNVVEAMVTMDAGEVGVLIEALKMFKNRIEK